MTTTVEVEAAELAAAVCRVLAQRNVAAVYSGDLFDELRRAPDAYGFTPELQQLSVYQMFDRLNRACRLGLLARRRQPGGPVWWSHPCVEVCDIVDETIPAIVTADTLADQIEQEPQTAWNTHALTDSNSENRVVFTDMENGQFRLDWKWDGHPLGYCFVDIADIEALAAWLREALTTDAYPSSTAGRDLQGRQEVDEDQEAVYQSVVDLMKAPWPPRAEETS